MAPLGAGTQSTNDRVHRLHGSRQDPRGEGRGRRARRPRRPTSTRRSSASWESRSAEVFASDGEARFREAEERHALEALGRGGLVSLGGGAVESAKVREALADSFVAWCRISEEAAWIRCEGTERPLAQDRRCLRPALRTRASPSTRSLPTLS